MSTKQDTVISSPDLSKIIKPEHENKWIALSPDYRRVVSFGGTLKEADSKVEAGERERVVFYKVLPRNSYYEPLFL